jgi:hypothetical protein
MSVHDLTVAALREGGFPEAADALEAVGPNRVGDPMIGSVAWLPHEQLVGVARAAILAHQRYGTTGWHWDDPDELADAMAYGVDMRP